MNEKNGADSIRKTPGKRLPALMDGEIVLLPEAVLPLPRMGRRILPGGLQEREWFDIVSEILIPRWAVECIRDNLVWGQELRAGESLKERVETILHTPGERDKWERIVGWGRRPVRALNMETAEKWSGGWSDLVALDKGKRIPYTVHLAFSNRYSEYLGVAYWESWVCDAGDLMAMMRRLKDGMLTGSLRARAARLVAEAKTYWGSYPIPGKQCISSDGTRKGNQDVEEMCLCLSELLIPPAERKISEEKLRMLFATNSAYYLDVARRALDRVNHDARNQVLLAQMEAKVAEAEADKFQAEQKAMAEAKARAEAAAAKARLAEAERNEAKWKAEAETWQRRHDALLGMKKDRDEAVKTPGSVAHALYELLEKQLTPEERDLRDWLMNGGSQTAWGQDRAKKGWPGSKGYVSKIRAGIEKKYKAAGLAGSPFPRCKGGRPPVKRMRGEASGTTDDAELRGRLNTKAQTSKRQTSDRE